MNNAYFKPEIMYRVYTVYLIRKMVQPIAIKIYLLFGLLAVSQFLVSVPHIITNALRPASTLKYEYHFILSAFFHTELITKIIALALVALALVFIWDLSRLCMKISIRSYLALRRS